ncbi:MAG: photosystem II cytochrome PsbV2 [Chroococcales cyanobacterium]
MSLLRKPLFLLRSFFCLCLIGLSLVISTQPAYAVDTYVKRYLASEPLELKADEQGNTQTFTPDDLSQGKELFELHCLNCHVGGATLPDPLISLSLEDLQGATPPRDNIHALVAFMREPMNYDGTDYSLWCRQVSEKWMNEKQVKNLAGFVLRAAEAAPGWGTETF